MLRTSTTLRLIFTTLLSTSSLFFSATVFSWTLVSDQSSVSFVSIKKNNIAESHRFTDFTGSIEDQNARVVIKAYSVDTRVPIRDERMREFLFKTGMYPTIEVKVALTDQLNGFKSGDTKLLNLPATLSLHGQTKEIELNVRLTALNDNHLLVSSAQPVLIRAANFELVEGIKKLSSLVNNLAIAETVPVSFSLLFKK